MSRTSHPTSSHATAHDDRRHRALDAMVDGVAIYRAVRDARGEIVDFTVEYMNEAARRSSAMTRAPVPREPLSALMPRYRASGLFDEHVQVVMSGEPLETERDGYHDIDGHGAAQGAVFHVRYSPLDDGLVAVWREVTVPVRERARLEETCARLQSALEAQASTNARLRAMLSNLPGGAAFVVNHELRYVEAGGEALRTNDISEIAFLGHTVAEMHAPSTASRIEANYRRALAGETFESLLQHGTRTYVTRGCPIRDATGTITGALAVSTDITERMQFEEAIAEERDRVKAEREALSSLVEGLPVLIAMYEPDLISGTAGRIRVNRAFVETLGWTAADEDPLHLMSRCYPDAEVRAMALDHMQRPDSGGATVRWLELPTCGLDGRPVPLLWGNIRLAGNRQVGVGVDLTEVTEAERALAASEAKYHALFASLDQGFALIEIIEHEGPDGPVGVDYRFLEVNGAFEVHTGLHAAVGRTARELVPDLEQVWIDRYWRVAATGEPHRFVEHAAAMQGRWFDVFAFRMGGSDSRLVGIHFADITAAREAALERERLLHEAESARAEAEAARQVADLERRRLEAVLDNLPVAVGVAEAPSGRIVRVNDALHRITGSPDMGGGDDGAAVTMVGYRRRSDGTLAGRYRPEDWPLVRAIRTGLPVRDELAELERANGTHAVVSFSAAPVRGPDGTVVGGVVTMTDVTEREQQLASMQRARAEAEAANRAKSQFLANVSHELRTPLQAIQNHVYILEQELHGPVTAPQREALARVQRAQKHLLALLNDVLTFAKAESASIEYHIMPVSAEVIARDVCAMLEPQAAARGLSLAVEVRTSDAPMVRADPEKLVQVLLNLLANAIKFTPAAARGDGARPIRVEIMSAGRPEHTEICVHDHGIGIPSDRLDTIFDAFVQIPSSETGRNDGAGLGLAIARTLMRGMGGEIDVTSRPGEGSTFRLVLPVA